MHQVDEIGVAIVSEEDLVANKRLYSLRDVTGTSLNPRLRHQ